jgi:hypothetical protein
MWREAGGNREGEKEMDEREETWASKPLFTGHTTSPLPCKKSTRHDHYCNQQPATSNQLPATSSTGLGQRGSSRLTLAQESGDLHRTGHNSCDANSAKANPTIGPQCQCHRHRHQAQAQAQPRLDLGPYAVLPVRLVTRNIAKQLMCNVQSIKPMTILFMSFERHFHRPIPP